MANPVAAKIRASFPDLYGNNPDDAAVINDFQGRGKTLVGQDFDPAIWREKVTKNTGHQFDQSHDTFGGAVKTGLKAAGNAFTMGGLGAFEKWRTGEDLISEEEIRDNGIANMLGTIGGSVVGLGKFSAAGALGRGAARGLAAAIGKGGVRAAHLGDVGGKILGGGAFGVAQEDERQREEIASNATGTLGGNPALAKAIAGLGGAALGVPLRGMHTAGLLGKTRFANGVSELAERGENVLTAGLSHIGNSAAAATASGTPGRFGEEFADPWNIAMNAAFPIGLDPKLQRWVGSKLPGALGGGPGTGAPGGPTPNPGNSATPGAGSATPAAQPNLASQAEWASIYSDAPATIDKYGPQLDARVQLQRMRKMDEEAQKSMMAQGYKGSAGYAIVDAGQGLQKAKVLNPSANDKGEILMQFGTADPVFVPLTFVKDMEIGVDPGQGHAPLTGRWDGAHPGAGFRAHTPEPFLVDDPATGQKTLAGVLFGSQRDSAGNTKLAIARQGQPHRLYAQGQDLDDDRLLNHFATAKTRIENGGTPPAAPGPAQIRGLHDELGRPYSRDLVLEKVGILPQTIQDALDKAAARRGSGPRGPIPNPSAGSTQAPSQGYSEDELKALIAQMQAQGGLFPGGGS